MGLTNIIVKTTVKTKKGSKNFMKKKLSFLCYLNEGN